MYFFDGSQSRRKLWSMNLFGYDVLSLNATFGGYAGILNGSVNSKNRFTGGRAEGFARAADIIASLAKDETVKIFGHSMGGAFARGVAQGLREYAEQNEISNLRIEFMVDLAAFDSFLYSNFLRKSVDVEYHFKASSWQDPWAGPGLPQMLSGIIDLPVGARGHGLGNYDADDVLNEIVRWAREAIFQ